MKKRHGQIILFQDGSMIGLNDKLIINSMLNGLLIVDLDLLV